MGTLARTIAVIDDETSLQEVLAEALADAGYRPLTWSCAQETLAAIVGARPEAILLDVWEKAPERGLALLSQLRAEPTTRCIPVIALSGDGHPPRAVDYRERGCVGVLSKPFDLNQLLAMLANVVHTADDGELLLEG